MVAPWIAVVGKEESQDIWCLAWVHNDAINQTRSPRGQAGLKRTIMTLALGTGDVWLIYCHVTNCPKMQWVNITATLFFALMLQPRLGSAGPLCCWSAKVTLVTVNRSGVGWAQPGCWVDSWLSLHVVSSAALSMVLI
jgi:hypothetical protein